MNITKCTSWQEWEKEIAIRRAAVPEGEIDERLDWWPQEGWDDSRIDAMLQKAGVPPPLGVGQILTNFPDVPATYLYWEDIADRPFLYVGRTQHLYVRNSQHRCGKGAKGQDGTGWYLAWEEEFDAWTGGDGTDHGAIPLVFIWPNDSQEFEDSLLTALQPRFNKSYRHHGGDQ